MLENSLFRYAAFTTFSILLGCVLVYLFIQQGMIEQSLCLSIIILNLIAIFMILSKNKNLVYFLPLFLFLLTSLYIMFVSSLLEPRLVGIIYLINGSLFPALVIIYLNLLEGYKAELSVAIFNIFYYLVFLLAFNSSIIFTYAFFSTWVHV